MMPAEDETAHKQKIGVTAVLEDKWWEKNNMANKIDIAADPELKRTKSGKMVVVKPKYNRGWGMILFAIILRIVGIIGGALTLATGAWIMYKTVTSYVAGSWVQTKASYGAMAVFLIIAGVFVIVVECRTKSIMRGCLNTYILVANYVTRGIFCLAIGALMFTSIVQSFPYPPPLGSGVNVFLYVAILMLVIGLFNVVYYIFYYCHKRHKHVALAPKYVANAEEIAYGMNLYDPAQRKIEEEKMRKREEEHRAAALAAGGGTTPIPIRPEFARYASQMDGLDLKWSGKVARPRDHDAPPERQLPTIPTRTSSGVAY